MKKPDNVVADPMSMEYPTNVGAPAFTVPDVLTRKKERGSNAIHQIETKFEQLKEEYFRLVQLAEDTDLVYNANCGFNPVVGNVYHLYKSKDNIFLSMIDPNQWDKEWLGSFRLTAEHTWERVHSSP